MPRLLPAFVVATILAAGAWSCRPVDEARTPPPRPVPPATGRTGDLPGTATAASPSLPDASGIISVTLVPEAVHAGGETTGIKLDPAINAIDFSFVLPDAPYDRYTAFVRDSDGHDVSTHANLEPSNGHVSARVPAYVLKRGDYLVSLDALAADGSHQRVATYSFRVTR